MSDSIAEINEHSTVTIAEINRLIASHNRVVEVTRVILPQYVAEFFVV